MNNWEKDIWKTILETQKNEPTIYKCEFCNEPMTEDEYYFCDICPECRDDPNRSESYEQISMAIV